MRNAAPAAASNNQPAPLSSTTVVTNNIQGYSTVTNGTVTGNTAQTDSKWTTMARGLIQNNQIVLLQEVGSSGPRSA